MQPSAERSWMVIYHSAIMLKPSDHFHGITIINNGSSVTPAPPAAAHLQSSIPSQECPFMQQNAFRGRGRSDSRTPAQNRFRARRADRGGDRSPAADFALAPFPGGRPAVMALLSAAGFRMSAKPCGFCQSTA